MKDLSIFAPNIGFFAKFGVKFPDLDSSIQVNICQHVFQSEFVCRVIVQGNHTEGQIGGTQMNILVALSWVALISQMFFLGLVQGRDSV